MAVDDEALHQRVVFDDDIDHNRVSGLLFCITNLQRRIALPREPAIKIILQIIRRQIEFPACRIPSRIRYVECRAHVIACGPCP